MAPGPPPADAADAVLAALPPGALIVTANRRLAAHLTERHDRARMAAGATAWPAPDILPLSAWAARAAESVWPERHTLADGHARLVWERVVVESPAGSGLLQPAAAARKAWDAWQLATAWRVPLEAAEGGRETQVFLDWADAYRATCDRAGWDDPAARLDRLAGWLREGAVQAPPVAWFAGFDRIAPDLESVRAALRGAGCDVRDWPAPGLGAKAVRIAGDDPAHEAALAARWARRAAERGRRVGIVTPDLAAYRPYLERALTEQLTPGRVPGTGEPGAANFSLGLPLSAEPVVAGALALLAVDRRALPVARLGAILRAPWLGAAEGTARALAAARLLSRRRADWTLAGLTAVLAEEAALPESVRRLRGWLGALDDQGAMRAPSDWARAFWDQLKAIGWPGDVPADSVAYQAVARFGDLLGELAALDPVAEQLARPDAVARLAAMAGEAVFQSQGADAPVQVMGVLEAAGMGFDALWLIGFRDDLWPLPAAPNPFLPLSMQRRLDLPRSGPAVELAFARAATARLLASAPAVVASHPREADGECGSSPLLAHLPEITPDALELAPDLAHAPRMAASAVLDAVDDSAGPPLAEGAAPGGTGLFADQAACPFRAFAAHRLGARLEEEAEPGLDALERGNLAHFALEGAWRRLKDSDGLRQAAEAGTLAELLAQAADEAVTRVRGRTGLADAFAAMERRRIAGLLDEWLAVERLRGPFAVQSMELKTEASAGGVTVSARIDRIDRLPDGREVLVDYKTGQGRVSDWFGERPEAPQLPLYALTRENPVAGVAFARARRGECGFVGIAEGEGVLPGVSAFPPRRVPDGAPPDWKGVPAAWRAALDRLGAEFATGRAAVDPKRYPATCQYCDLDPLCRVWEGRAEAEAENGDE